MADILNLSFGCGNTLLAGQLNQIVEAINRIYNTQKGIYIDNSAQSIKLADNSNSITKSELLTFLGISGSNYIPISGSDDISGSLIPDGSDNYNLGDEYNYWKDIYTSTEHAKILKFHSQLYSLLLLTYELLGELYVGKDTSNNNETILHFKHGNNNEEIIATRDWVNSLLNPTRINIGSTGSISEELYNDESNYIKIESSSDNPIVIAGYDENTLPSGIKFGDASTGDVLTVHGGKIYINGDIFSGENGATELNDLSDVNASAPGTGDFLMYNGTRWVSNPLPESLIIHPSDVSINEEYYLKYEIDEEHPSGWYSWVERPAGANELNELNDVEINYTDLGLGQVLVYSQVTDEEDNTYYSWTNKTLSGSLTYNQSDSNKYLKVNLQGTETEWSDISLSDLSNTEIGGSNNPLSNGLVLVYDLSSSNWKNASLPANLPSVSGHANEYLKVKSDGTLAEWTSVAPDSGLTGIKYQNTGGSATTITPSSGCVTLKAGNNVSFTPSTGGILEISASGGGAGNLPSGGINGDHLIMGSNGPEWETSYNIYLVENGNKTLNGTITPQSTSSGGGIFIGTNRSGTYSSLTNPILLSPGTGGVDILGTSNVSYKGNLKVDNSGNFVISSPIDCILQSDNSGYIYLNSSRIYLNTNNNSNNSGHWLSVDSNGKLNYDGAVIGGGSGSYTLPAATSSALGGIKIGYSESNSGSNTNRNYAVQLDSNNKAYVNVPWSTSNLTLSGLIGSSSIGGQTTPIYWNGSTFQTCDTQTSGITSIAVGTPSLLLTPSSGSVTIPSLTLNSTGYGVIKANGSFSAPNYPVKTDNSGSAYITLAIGDLMGSSAVGNLTTPVYWTGSAFSTCNIQNSGSSNRTLENSTTRNNLKSAFERDGSDCIIFDNLDSNNNVTSINFIRVSELRYKAKKSLNGKYFYYRGNLPSDNLSGYIIRPIFYVDSSYKICPVKVGTYYACFTSVGSISTSLAWINLSGKDALLNLLSTKYGITCTIVTTTSDNYMTFTNSQSLLILLNFYVESDD